MIEDPNDIERRIASSFDHLREDVYRTVDTTEAAQSLDRRRPWYVFAGPALAVGVIIIVAGIFIGRATRDGDDEVDLATDTEQTASTTTTVAQGENDGQSGPGATVADDPDDDPGETDSTTPQTTVPVGGGRPNAALDWIYPIVVDPNSTAHCTPETLLAEFWTSYVGYQDPEVAAKRELAPANVEFDVKARGEGGVALDNRFSTVGIAPIDQPVATSCQPYGVVSVRTADVVIDAPTSGNSVSSPLVIAGRGTGFEATIDIEFRAADGSVLDQNFATAGNFGEPAHFAKSFDLPATTSDQLVIILWPSGGADGEELPMTMKRVGFDPTGSGWGSIAPVVDVASDDVLNIRQAPNAGAQLVGTIPFDATDVALTGGTDGDWVTVTYDGVRGWVNGTFLG